MKDRRYPGYLISFEGGEGSGKSSGVKHVVEDLNKRGYGDVVMVIREPGGSEICEEIREIILKFRGGKQMNSLTETLLFQASRSEICEDKIWPALMEGKVVVLDRFRDSGVVYQGFARGVGCGRVDDLNDISTNGLEPDLTILFDVDPEIGLSRPKGDGWNRLDAEGPTFHKNINWAYRQLADFDRMLSDNPRWEIVNANLSEEEVRAETFKIVEGRLLSAGFFEGNRRGVEY